MQRRLGRWPGQLTVLMVVVVLTWAARPAHAQQDVEIGIHERGRRVPTLALAHFPEDGHGPGRIGVQLRNVLRDDLAFSGVFDVQEPPPPRGGQDLAAARDGGLQVIVRGEYQLDGDEFVWEVRAFDVAFEKQLTGKRYRAALDAWRTVAHAFADELLAAFTGKPGVAQTRIAFLATKGGAKELFIMDYDGQDPRRVTQHGNLVVAPAWAPDGETMFYTSYHQGNPDLYRATLKTGDVEQVAAYNGLNTAAAVSPDGTEVALTLSRDGNSEIYRMTLATRRLRRLTFGSGVDTQPTWSPNGQELAFVSDREGAPRVYIMDRDGADVRRVVYGVGYTTSPAWSPLGDRIAFVALVDGVLQLMTVTPQGTGLTQLTRGMASCEDPSWSPDGRHVAYSRTEKRNTSEIWVIRADGTGDRRVSRRGAECTSPAWSPRPK